MTLSIFSFTQKPGQAGAVTEPRTMADSGALPASRAFAERLQQQLQTPPSPEVPHPAPRPAVHQEPVPSSQDPTPDEPDAATRQARRSPVPQRPRAPAPPTQRPAEAQPADRAAAEAKAAAPEATDADTDTAADAAAPGTRRGRSADASTDTSTPLNWMLQWVAGKPQPDAAAAGGSMLSRGGAGDTALGRAGKGHAGAGRLMPDDAAGQAAGSAPAGTREAWQAALDAQAVLPDHALAQEHALAAASGTPAVAAWAPVAGAAGLPDAPAPVQVSLDTPVNRPEFRDELAAQVSRFAHDGIQEAVLNLNPAEMGPITVQIVLDGTQATVDFQAVQPATRELIEASLPALASALHGEGLTLSGGSVGDQRRPSQGDPQAHGGRRGGADGNAGGIRMAPGHAAARRADGVLDLYA
ncbi:MAG TPA: flagellar hook-length control protein FliK [Burkholderiaceae bacterium]|nr:flagellar hook-length control protein FliK [Burkholderiaceae bacterium]